MTSSVTKPIPITVVTVTTKLPAPAKRATSAAVTAPQPRTTVIRSIRTIKLAATKNPIRLTTLQTTKNVTAPQASNNPPSTLNDSKAGAGKVISHGANLTKTEPVNPTDASPIVIDAVPPTSNSNAATAPNSNSPPTDNSTAGPDDLQLTIPLATDAPAEAAVITTVQLAPMPVLGQGTADAAPLQNLVAILNCGSPDCEQAAKHLKPTPLSNISLDIAPTFKPNLDDKPAKLQAEVRAWTNRQGKVIASGQLADYTFSKIEIQLANGTITKIPMTDLSVDDACYVADTWGFPKQCRIGLDAYDLRNWEPIKFTWKASALAQKPLYFEDVQLERYGHTMGPWLQPARSGAHFFLNIAVLPYHMGIHPWNECQYSLGYYRPGSLAPRQIPAFPLNVKASLWQAGAIIGGVYLIP
ncbi:MAG: hypothetical protein HOB73_08560 [Planctomycetaceae bacterium]|nr:hypothetical protein [Planctomycetaceae bacterium]